MFFQRWKIQVFLGLIATACVTSITFTTSDCGKTKGCFFSPTSCSDSTDCDFLVTYNKPAGNDDVIEFELSAKAEYAGLGFSDDKLMADTDILVCYNDGGQATLGHFYADSQTQPAKTTPTPSALKLIESEFAGGVVKCRFTRETNPNIPNFKDINEKVFLLVATGKVDNAEIQYHQDKVPGITGSKIDVKAVENQEAAGVATPLQTQDCGKTKGCFFSPTSCSDSTDCDFLVTYNKPAGNDDVIEFELSAKAEYAGLGFSDDKLMADTDILVCYNDGGQATLGHFYADSQTQPAKTTPTPSALKLIESEFAGGVVKCRFTRETNPNIPNFKDINEKVFLLVATGKVDNGAIQYHKDKAPGITGSKVDVKTAENQEAAGVATLLQAHGALMIIAWVCLVPVGMFIARYTRMLWGDQTLCGGKVWFQVHRIIMATAVLATIVGFILIFVHTKSWSSTAGAHPYLGIIVLALAIAQPIMAAFRPHPGEPKRFIFNWAHRIVGSSALILGVVTVLLGVCLPQVRLDMRPVYAIIAFYAGEGVIVAFEVALLLARRVKTTPTSSISGRTGELQIQEPGAKQTAPAISERESTLRLVMLMFVILLVVSVTTVLIVFIATA